MPATVNHSPEGTQLIDAHVMNAIDGKAFLVHEAVQVGLYKVLRELVQHHDSRAEPKTSRI